MENKYYTPELNEFHIDFEYEYLDNDIWHKAKPTEISVKDFEDQLYGLRVKYLSKEDIESLGFIFKGKSIDNWYYMNGNFERSLSNSRNMSISIQHDFRDNNGIVIRGFEWSDTNGEEEVLYRGSCKNKSELIKILKNTNICQKD